MSGLWQGFRSRLFVVSVALVVVSATASTIWLRAAVRPLLQREAESRLLQQARVSAEAAAALLAQNPRPTGNGALPDAALDALADRLGEAADGRVTLIDETGAVLGDSHVDHAALGQLHDHSDRPEVSGALAAPAGWAAARRHSATLDREMLYVAARAPTGAAGGPALIVRASLPSDRVDAPLHRLYQLILVGAAIGLVVSGFMTVLASGLMSRDLRRLTHHTTRLARGEQAEPLVLAGPLELAGIAGSVQSISADLQRTVSSLAAERRQLEAILDSMSEGILSIDGGRVARINGACTRMLGCADRDRGRKVHKVLDDAELLALIDRARPGQAEELTLEREVAGEPHLLLARVEGRPDGTTVVVLHDVTNLHRLETIRRDFVANVSHELRTPVSVVQASAEALQDGALEQPAIARRFVDAILRNTERLGLLISDLLSLSRIEAGRYTFAFTTLTVRPVVDEVVEVLALRARARSHVLQVDVPDDVAVHGDAGALEQVLVNLLENAMKYTPDGGRIHVRMAPAPAGRVRIEVADNGPGIEPAHQDRVFERFYRVDTGRSREVGGTGLGLAIVKHLCESMGGAVGVTANQPKGSVFWVELARPGSPLTRPGARPALGKDAAAGIAAAFAPEPP